VSTDLAIRSASVEIGPAKLLRDVSFVAPSSAITALIGPNGAGKSTLMRAVLGLVPLTAGAISFDGANLLAMTRRDRSRITAFVEQSGTTEARLSAREVVMLGRIPFQSVWQSAPSPADDIAVDEAIAAVGMADLAARHYHTLSGGEQQRLQIARALAQQPRLLILDEPTNHLDVHAQLAVLSLLRRRAQAGVTVLLALHDLNLAAAFCDTLVVLDQGRLIASGAPESVLTPALLRSVYQVDATLLRHPTTGRPLIAYDLPSE
jgi:iron complex transport system ATP-binding protein